MLNSVLNKVQQFSQAVPGVLRQVFEPEMNHRAENTGQTAPPKPTSLDFVLPQRQNDLDQYNAAGPRRIQDPAILASNSLYGRLVEKTRRCGQMGPDGWREMLAYANLEVLPRLKSEEAALQFLCHNLAYCHPRLNDEIRLNIKHGIIDSRYEKKHGFTNPAQKSISYAANYLTDRTYNCPRYAVIVWQLRPVGFESGSKTAIIVFRGTRPGGGLAAHGTELFNRGLADDFDPRGIGHKGFDHNREILQDWCGDLLAAHTHLVLCGHSLGGAYAARTLASLPKQLQARTRLVTFNAPAIDRKTADSVYHYHDNVRLIRHRDDIVHRAGNRHPRGAVLIQTSARWEEEGYTFVHGMDTLVRAALNNLSIDATLKIDDHGEQAPQLENLRVRAAQNFGYLLP